MLEQSKAAKRRFYNGNFHNRYFNGSGIDIGGKPDPFSQYIGVFPLVKDVKIWDLEDGDAQYMKNCSDESYDFLVSSHCLEHMNDVEEALSNWIRITKPGGYMVITIPDEDMYEQEQWPSKYNDDHKWTFTIYKNKSWSTKSINLLELLIKFQHLIEIEKIEKISDFYNYNLSFVDQTLNPNIESAIEIIIQKRSNNKIINIQKNRFHMEEIPSISFETKVSNLFNTIQKLNLDKRYVIYGYGNVGKILDKTLKNSIIGFVDKKSELMSKKINREEIYSPSNLLNMEFDYIIISVLGREEEIKTFLEKDLSIYKDKIICLS